MMKHTCLAGIIAVLFSTNGSFAASEAYIDQLGDNLSPVSINQMVSIDDLAGMASSAAETLTTIRNTYGRPGSSAALLVQEGEGHLAGIDQSGDDHLGVIMQSGSMNSASILQTGSRNSALIAQSGYGNFASVSQSGSNHNAYLVQQGRNNVAIISQR